MWRHSLAGVALGFVLPMTAAAQRTVVMPHATCSQRTWVPASAPDTVAEQIIDSLGTVPAAAQQGVNYIQNLLAAKFTPDAGRDVRQAAVDRVCGVVIGGDYRDGGDDGYYLIRLHNAGSASALDAAASALARMPGVKSAQPLAVRSASVQMAPSSADRGAGCADGSTGGMLRIEALKEMLASPDPTNQGIADALGLTGVDTNSIKVVDDGLTCARVASAIRQGARFSLEGSPFLVLRAGPRYVAFDPRGFDRSFFVVDTSFVFRRVLR